MVGKPAWVKNGNQTPYHLAMTQRRTRVNFKPPGGLLPPIDKLQIEDVMAGKSGRYLRSQVRWPEHKKEVMAVFEKSGEPGRDAVSIEATPAMTTPLRAQPATTFRRPS